MQKYKKFLELQAEREKSLDWGKKKASKQKKYQNIWNLLKDFISLHRQNISFGYPGRIPREAGLY